MKDLRKHFFLLLSFHLGIGFSIFGERGGTRYLEYPPVLVDRLRFLSSVFRVGNSIVWFFNLGTAPRAGALT